MTLHISREKDEEIALVVIMAVRAEGRATNSTSLCAKEASAMTHNAVLAVISLVAREEFLTH